MVVTTPVTVAPDEEAFPERLVLTSSDVPVTPDKLDALMKKPLSGMFEISDPLIAGASPAAPVCL